MRPTGTVRRNPVFRTVAKLCQQYLKWYGNASYKRDRNGEGWVLATLGAEPLRTIFDVGANVGDWSLLAAETFPAATLYSFEIVPATAATLRTRTAAGGRVRAFDFGLAERSGTLTMRYNPAASAHSTYTEYPHGWTGERLECRVERGDDFLTRNDIREIDFLKIDVEGAEHLVLRGFERALADRRIRFVQFEYGRVNILTGFLLKDFYDLFARLGYVVGKVYPDYVEFRDYRLSDEDFLGPNFLACRADEPRLTALRR